VTRPAPGSHGPLFPRDSCVTPGVRNRTRRRLRCTSKTKPPLLTEAL